MQSRSISTLCCLAGRYRYTRTLRRGRFELVDEAVSLHAEQNMSMKENQNPTAYDSLTFGSKKVFETKVSDDNIKGIGDVSTVNGSRARKDDQNGISKNADDLEKDSGSLSLSHDKCEHSVKVDEFTLCNGNGNEHEDSISQWEGSIDLFETIKNDFSDKNVLECYRPELEIMKDICVDNGSPEVKDEKDGKLFELESLKPFSAGTSENGTAELCDLSELVQASTKPSEDNSLVCKKHPVQEAGTQDLLESFPNSSDGEGRKLVQPTNQNEVGKDCDSLLQKIPIEKAISVLPATSSSEAGGPKDNAQAGSLLFDSDMQSRSITVNVSDTKQVQCTTRSIVGLHEQSDGSSANSNIQCVSSGKQHMGANSDGFSPAGQVRSPSDESQCSTNDNSPSVNPGETSFSAVTYSDPVCFSRSLSHRSDASTTSARSFAFPVLQSEWNSSPVRMAKADQRHFRKQKGWRSGVLCCRF